MDNNPVVPPSMISAGAMTPPTDPTSIVDMLRSQGSMPSAALAQIVPPIAPPVPQVSPGLSFGSGVLSALAGHPGQNPYLAQQAHAQAQQQAQQMQMAQMAQRQQERNQAMEERRQQALLAVSQSLLQSQSPEAALIGARGVQAYSKKVGLVIPDTAVEDMARKVLSADQYNDIMKRVGMGYDDATLLTMYPNLKPAALAQIKAVMQNPVALKAVGLQTPDEQKKAAFDLQIAEANAVQSKFPELSGDPALVHAVINMHRKQNNGQDYTAGTNESRQKAYDAAVAVKEAREDARDRQKADLAMQRMLAGIDARLALQNQKPLTEADKIRLTKQTEPIKKQAATLEQIDKLLDVIDQIPNDALPKGTDYASQMWAKGKRELLYRNEDSLFKFRQLWAPLNIGQIDRNMFDEKGVRSIQAFQKQLEAVDQMPPKSAVKSYLNHIRTSIINKGNQNIREAERFGFRPEVLDVMREVWAPWGNPGKAPSPLQPNLPPGTKLEDGKLVSESGKYEWNGSQWIPRTP